MTTSRKGYLYALLTALCWSTSGLFVKLVSQPALIIAGVEALVGIVFVYYVNRGKIYFSKYVLIVGFCQFMMHITFVCANQLSSVGNVIVLQYSSMIFVLFFESISRKKLPVLYQWGVIAVAVAGMLLFFYDSFSFDSAFGNALAIISGFFFGLQFYLNTKQKAMPESSLIMQFIITILVMLVYITYSKHIWITSREYIVLFASGIIHTVLAGLFFAKCVRLISAFTANVICMSEVVFAPLWALILLNERFTPMSLFGACIIVSSLIFNSYMEIKYKNNKEVDYV